jgi:hypothetical protein
MAFWGQYSGVPIRMDNLFAHCDPEALKHGIDRLRRDQAYLVPVHSDQGYNEAYRNKKQFAHMVKLIQNTEGYYGNVSNSEAINGQWESVHGSEPDSDLDPLKDSINEVVREIFSLVLQSIY